MAIASANGLLLKGGREAQQTNNVLMSIVHEALGMYFSILAKSHIFYYNKKNPLGNYGCADAISMVSGREAVGDLLKMDEYIDLVIPRGSGELVK